jgi:hypothetical protein
LPTWSHTFVCLGCSSQDTLPDGEERAALQIAGLGEKKVSLCAFSDAQDIYAELLTQFPKLSQAGGFEFLRVPEGGGKQLDVIAAPDSGYTGSYLRAVVHHAKIYVRPLQRDLSLDPVKDEAFSEPPKEECLTCGKMVSLTSLREHVVGCKRRPTECKFSDKEREKHVVEHPSNPTVLDDPKEDPIVIDCNSPVEVNDHEDLDPVLEVAMHLSKEDWGPSHPETEPQTIVELITHLQ